MGYAGVVDLPPCHPCSIGCSLRIRRVFAWKPWCWSAVLWTKHEESRNELLTSHCPLVMTNIADIAFEHGHLVRWFTHWKLLFSTVMLVYQRVHGITSQYKQLRIIPNYHYKLLQTIINHYHYVLPALKHVMEPKNFVEIHYKGGAMILGQAWMASGSSRMNFISDWKIATSNTITRSNKQDFWDC